MDLHTLAPCARSGAIAVLLTACPGEAGTCEENAAAQTLEDVVTVQVGGAELLAERADDAVERDRGWRHRECDREALLLVPDQRGPLPIWGCELTAPIDVAFIDAGAIVEVAHEVVPCPAPCGDCPLFGEGIDVEAVLEIPVDAVDLTVGTDVVF